MFVALLFCFRLFETMVNSFSPLLLRDAIFSAYVTPWIRGMTSFLSNGGSQPSSVRVLCVSSLVVFCFGFDSVD